MLLKSETNSNLEGRSMEKNNFILEKRTNLSFSWTDGQHFFFRVIHSKQVQN